MDKGIIFYTENQLPENIARAVRQQLLTIGLPIISSSLEPLDFGDNEVAPGPRGYKSMFEQILSCLERSTAKVVFFCEHDVLYPKEHFDFMPDSSKFYYDINWWKVGNGDLAVHWDAAQVSGLCCYRELALKFYRSRVATFDPEDFDRKFEPTIETEYETWRAKVPHIDIRHNRNTTYNKWKLEHFRKRETAVNFQEANIDNIPGWENLRTLLY